MLPSPLASAAPLALQALRCISTSSSAAAAAPALASKGLFSASRVDVPLTEALPTAPPFGKSSIPSVAPKLQSTELAGHKLVAIDSPGPVTCVTLALSAGPDALGSSKVLQDLAFKASANRTTFRITRELEKIGAAASVAAGRDHLALSISAPKLHAPEVTELLLDTVLNAKLNYWEVQEAIASAKAKLAAARQDPAVVVADALHRAAFDGGLGLPLHPDPSALDHLDGDHLKAYLSAALAPGSAVLAAAGVGLEDFSSLAGPLLSAAGGGGAKKAAAPTSTYAGGALSVLSGASEGLVHLGLAFEAKGGRADAKGAAAAAVAKALLDGPGAALPHAGEGEGAPALAGYSGLYASTGLLGVVGAAPASQVRHTCLSRAVCGRGVRQGEGGDGHMNGSGGVGGLACCRWARRWTRRARSSRPWPRACPSPRSRPPSRWVFGGVGSVWGRPSEACAGGRRPPTSATPGRCIVRPPAACVCACARRALSWC